MRSDDDLAAALARVRALGPGVRSSLTGGWIPSASEDAAGSRGAAPGNDLPSSDPPDDDAAPDDDVARDDDAAAVVARLRARALVVASTGYTAAHGHPLDHAALDPGARRWRWLLSRRGAAAVGLVLALLVIVVLARTSGRMPTTALPVRDPSGSLVASALGTPGVKTSPTTAAVAGAPAAGVPGAGVPGAGTEVTVHTVGQVRTPGLRRLPPGARVADAISAAGGATEEADLAAVNLARLLVDGEQVYVPARGELSRAQPAGSGPSGASPGGTVNLNTADVAALDTLPGIGPVLAGRIVAWRQQHGRFSAVDELGEVTGIGPTLLSKIRDRVAV